MTAPAINLTEAQILGAVRAFLLGVLPTGMEVVKGMDNRVPEPRGANFVVMTTVLRNRLGTNTDIYTDGYPSGASVKAVTQKSSITVQLDLHGPAAADNACIVSTLFRDEIGVSALAATGCVVYPLYTSEPRQVPYVNGEHQVEVRWVVDLVVQANQTLTLSQDFADTLHAGIINVDASYPP